MKIAQLSATFPPYMAGSGNVCFNYSLELAKRGHEVTVYTSKYLESNNETTDLFKVKRFNPLFKIGNAPFMPQFMNIKNFDIIHLHYPFYFGGEMIYFLRKLKNQKYIISYHNNLSYYRYISPFLNKFVRIHDKLISKRILENAENVIVPTLDFYHSIDFKLNQDFITEIPNGVDLSIFTNFEDDIRTALGLEYSKIILFVGALDKAHFYKGLEILMLSFKKLLKDYDNIKLIVIGGGNLEGYYKNLSKEFKIEKSIIFIGPITDFKKLARYYNTADVVVYPTFASESFGMVLAESMAMGKPIIASNVPGVRSVVDNKENGLLFEPKNVDELTSKISYLLENEDIRKSLGVMGRKKAIEMYSWYCIVNKVEAVYNKFLETNGI